MPHLLQYRRRVIGSDGLTYLVARGRPYPKDEEPPPQPVVTAALTGFEVFSDSRADPNPGGGGGTPGGSAARDALVIDTYVPSNTTAGIYSPVSALTAYNAQSTANLTLSTANTVIQDKIIYGVVKRNCNNVIFRNCLFRGPPTKPTSETAMVNMNDTTFKGWEFYDCTFAPQWPNSYMDALKSNNFKAIRCHMFWTSDGIGIFSNSSNPANGGTNVEVAGCVIEDLGYWNGRLYAYYNGPTYLKTDGSYAAYNSANDALYVKRPTQQPSDLYFDVKDDGSHNDCIQIQGGYGRMVRNTTTGKWSGDGVYVHGNRIGGGDAIQNDGNATDRSGLGLPVPGTPGSLANSRIGYGDSNFRRTAGQTPTMTRPILNGDKMLPNGQYANHGSGIITQQNVNQYPYPNSANTTDYTVVIQYNYIDNYQIGIQTQKSSYPAIGAAILYNTFSANVFRYSSNVASSSSIFPIRVYDKAVTTFAKALDGTDGLATNKWDDPANIYGRNGLSLTNLPLQANGSDNPRGGLRYG